MKKAWIFLSAILLPGIYFAVTAQEYHFTDHEKLRNAERSRVASLVTSGLYDSAISYCAVLRKEDKLGYDDLEEALATIHWYKGDKKTSYQYLMNQVDYNLKTYAGERAFCTWLYDFDYAYPLATDSFLEQVVADKVKDFYLKQDFSDAASGYKMILLDYQLSKNAARFQYDMKHLSDTVQKNRTAIRYNEDKQALIARFLDLVRQHGDLLTWKEAGSGYQAQYSIIRFADDDILHRQLEPYFEKAYKEERILPEVYVDELVLKSGISKKDRNQANALRDSLCVVYKCTPTTKRTVITDKGDTITYIEADRPVRLIQQNK